MGTDGYKKKIILCSILAMGIIALSVIYALKSGAEKDPAKTGPPTVTEIPEVQDYSACEAMITEIDLDSSVIKVEELENGTKHELTYTGASDIRTKSGRSVTAAVLNPGNIVKLSFSEDNRLVSLYGHDDVWNYKNIENIYFTTDIKKIEVGSRVYRYNDSLKIINEGEFVDFETLALDGTDVVDLYGIGEYVYLVKVNAGHGYLTFANAEDFIGGSVSYGIGKSVILEEDMKIMLREGDYDVAVENNGYDAAATLRIRNNEDTVFDLAGYGPEPVEYGEVSFIIKPGDSDLYVDGVKTDYKEPVNLTLGYHEIEAVLGGYIDYRGSIDVSSEGTVKRISLSPAPKEVPEDIIYEDEPENEDNNAGSSGENKATATPAPTGTKDDSGSGGIEISIEPADDDDEDEDDPDFSSVDDVDVPDSTTDSGDGSDIEVVDGDEPDITEPEKQNNGVLIVYCDNGTEVYINGEYAGTIQDGSLTIDKPSGVIELELKKAGYVTKKYTLTMEKDQETQTYKFPSMTPEAAG